jgi:multiple sugar transport system substrate-binding protein
MYGGAHQQQDVAGCSPARFQLQKKHFPAPIRGGYQMKARFAPFALLMVAALVFTACAAPAPQVVEKIVTQVVKEEVQVVQTQIVEKVKEVQKIETQIVEKVVAATAMPEAKPVVTWFQYDQHNVDPKSDERVGNEYMRQAIPQFDKAFAGKWYWDNQFTPWDRAQQKTVAAVQASAEVPDLIDIGGSQVNNYYLNGTMQDLSEWAKAQPWYAQMDESSLKMCSGPDGKLYCIPMALRPSTVFVWKDRYPNGFPKTPEDWLAEGERLKAEGKYALTFFGSTAFDGNGAGRAVWQIISAFGGGYDDGAGKLKLNTPENVAAITWLREMVQKGYVPEITFAGGFQEEEAFKDSSAGAFPTGLFGYRYVNPLTAPSGTKYEKKNENDMFDAINAGDVYLAPMIAAAGQKPGCGADVTAFAIPVGATNVEGAQDMINWILSPEQNPAFVLGPGAGFPALKTIQETEQFQSKFYQQAAEVVAASNCSMYLPTITDNKGASIAVMNAVYKLIKEDPTADIAAELQKAEDEFNKGQ